MMIWLNLIRKEYSEHKWKLVSLTAIAASTIVMMACAAPDSVSTSMFLLCMGYVVIAPVFVAMGVASAEQSQRTIGFVLAQPVPRWKLAVSRIAGGLLVLAVPPVACWGIACVAIMLVPDQRVTVMPDSFTAADAILLDIPVAILASWNVYLWCVAVAMNQSSELKAGLIGIAVYAAMLGLLSLSVALFGDQYWVTELIGCVGPLYTVASVSTIINALSLWGEIPPDLWWVLLWYSTIQLLTLAGLMLVAIRRYGRDSGLTLPFIRPRSRQLETGTLGPPRRSPFGALLWQRWKESAWQVVLCLLLAVLLIPLVVERPSRFTSWTTMAGRGFFEASGWVGCVLALLLSVTAFTHDLEPRTHEFWRSRPISPIRWFWLKYLSGLLVLSTCLHIPTLLVLAVLREWMFLSADPAIFDDSLRLHSYIGEWPFARNGYAYSCAMLLHVVIYSFGVLAASVVRHPVYAIILTVCGTMAIVLPPESVDAWQDWSIGHWMRRVSVMGSGIGTARIGNLYLGVTRFLNPGVFLMGFAAAASVLAATAIRRDISVRT